MFQAVFKYDCLPLNKKPNTMILATASIVKMAVIEMSTYHVTQDSLELGSLSGESIDRLIVETVIATTVIKSKYFHVTSLLQITLRQLFGPNTNKLLPSKSIYLVNRRFMLMSDFAILAIETENLDCSPNFSFSCIPSTLMNFLFF